MGKMEGSSFNNGDKKETGNRFTQLLGSRVRREIETKIAGSKPDEASLWIPYLHGWNGCYIPKIAQKELTGISDTELGRKAYKFKGIKLALILALLSGSGYEVAQLMKSNSVQQSTINTKQK